MGPVSLATSVANFHESAIDLGSEYLLASNLNSEVILKGTRDRSDFFHVAGCVRQYVLRFSRSRSDSDISVIISMDQPLDSCTIQNHLHNCPPGTCPYQSAPPLNSRHRTIILKPYRFYCTHHHTPRPQPKPSQYPVCSRYRPADHCSTKQDQRVFQDKPPLYPDAYGTPPATK